MFFIKNKNKNFVLLEKLYFTRKSLVNMWIPLNPISTG